ncbi:PD40 domain-containing protein [Alteromonas flava]|uniref:HzsA-related protein n=1 Tax=Alteromonas flava TaxID=2048003 RepID=UPI000C292FBB|nr:PD40 domain-containing protein [Alteromonas flava]
MSAILAFVLGCGEETLPISNEQEPDPVVVDVPVAYIKRDLAINQDGGVAGLRDIEEPQQFLPGSALFIKSRASVSAPEVNITDRIFLVSGEESLPENLPAYDVKDLAVSYDGTRLLFALRLPESDNQPEPTWNVWEYDRVSDTLRRVIASDTIADSGDDTGPVYLADGRIVFSSTRQRANQAILLDEGKPQYSGLEESLQAHASVLHIMDADGANIEQISFNQSHDLDPIVAPDGKIIFSRWDQVAGDKGIHLYQMNADGTNLEILYGRHSHQVDSQRFDFIQTQITPDEQVLTALWERERARLGQDFAILDVAGFSDATVPTEGNPGGAGSAQNPALFDTVDTAAEYSPGGLYTALYPLWDGSGRYLFTWSQCRVLAPTDDTSSDPSERTILPCSQVDLSDLTYEPAPPLYGLWMYDPQENTQLPLAIPEEGIAYTEVVAMESRPFPQDPESAQQIPALVDANLGAIHIRSVYDFAGVDTSPAGITAMADPTLVSATERNERFLRITKSVSIPDDDTLDFDRRAFGRSRAQLMREILGYTPIQPDGSVYVTVPANVPFALSIVDASGQRLSARHNNWLQVKPGEVKTCNGCHTPQSTEPHGRLAAEAASINNGAPFSGVGFPGANPALFADMGETMAETYARVVGLPDLTADLVFEDVWTDPATTPVSPSILLSYAELQTLLPINQACAQTWQSLCRIEINYPQHIQPLFELVRETRDSDDNVLLDYTCTSCHSIQDSDGVAQVPSAQLDLRATPSIDDPNVLTSYRELFFADNAQELIEGVLVDIQEPVFDENGDPVFLVDEEGELILDAEGNPIQLTRPIRVNPAMSVNGALASQRFTRVFTRSEFSHAGWLSPIELKLLAEWLDIGGQYYNNPFAIPQN